MENNKKTLGGNIILAGSIFLNIYGVFFIYKALKLFTAGEEMLKESGGPILQGANVFLCLLIFIIAMFGIKQKNNVDAGKAVLNRGIFILVAIIAVGIANFVMLGFNYHFIVLALDGIIYAAGGFLNDLQAKKELEMGYVRK